MATTYYMCFANCCLQRVSSRLTGTPQSRNVRQPAKNEERVSCYYKIATDRSRIASRTRASYPVDYEEDMRTFVIRPAIKKAVDEAEYASVHRK